VSPVKSSRDADRRGGVAAHARADGDADLFLGRGRLDLRSAAGREARKRTPRSALGHCSIPQRDPIVLLEASNLGRVADLVPVRHGRMLASPFAFYRGAAALMAHDLAALPNSGISVQLCGDAHLANFGLFGSPERRILFGLNDFDETLPGPFDWDVRRLAASVVIAARDRGFGTHDQRRAVRATSAAFRRGIAESAGMDTMALWYRQLTADEVLALADSTAGRAREAAAVAKARKQGSRALLAHETEIVDGRVRIRDEPPHVFHYPAKSGRDKARFDALVRQFFAEYRLTLPDDRRALFDRFSLVDVAVRVVGVGSVGTRCFEALFVADGDSPLFLQVKEARASVLESHLPASVYDNHGRRVVAGQRLLQSASDIFLGWSTSSASGFDFYVRQLRDMKGSFDLTAFTAAELESYARACGLALAISMGKAGDPMPIAGYVGKSDAFDRAMERFAFAYADQNERDFAAFATAVKTGRLEAVQGA
jgi:uncharacterized protein (DUF2252 family)